MIYLRVQFVSESSFFDFLTNDEDILQSGVELMPSGVLPLTKRIHAHFAFRVLRCMLQTTEYFFFLNEDQCN